MFERTVYENGFVERVSYFEGFYGSTTSSEKEIGEGEGRTAASLSLYVVERERADGVTRVGFRNANNAKKRERHHIPAHPLRRAVSLSDVFRLVLQRRFA